MVNRLRTKLIRDVRAGIWQIVAISIVAGLGVAMFYGLLMGYSNQKISYAVSYQRLRFADVTIGLKRAPRAIVQRISGMPGVIHVDGRLVVDLDVEQSPGRRGRVTGRLVTLPPRDQPAVNQLLVLEGRLPIGGARREAALESSFAARHKYRPGDRIFPKLDGQRVAFTVTGIVSSPEYIYAVQSKQLLMPTPETFGVLFVRRDQIESLLGMAGSVNEVTLVTEPGQADRIGEEIRRRYSAYGSQDPMTRAEQPSNLLLQSDLDGYAPAAVLMPTLFLGTAALAVSLVLARWVQAQRGQVGFLRASGFPPSAILQHYLELGIAAGAGGGLVGVGLGYGYGLLISKVYADLLHMPYQIVEPHPELAVAGFGLSLVACGLGALGPARQAAAMSPAEAMRGQVPSSPMLAARIPLPLMLALPLRNLLRRPLRTLGTAVGVGASTILLILTGSMLDSLDASLRTYLKEVQNYDLLVGFSEPPADGILFHFRRWPGVLRVEPSLELPVRILHNGRSEETVMIGVLPGSQLRRLPSLDTGLPMFPLPGTVLFTDALMRKLNLERGNLLNIAYTQNTREFSAEANLRSGDPVHQPIGTPIYIGLRDLQLRYGVPLGLPPRGITGALLRVEPGYLASVRARFQARKDVALVQTSDELAAQIYELTAYSRTFMGIFMLFGAAMALAVTYTATDSILWERTRELATLRTLGFGMGRISILVALENMMVAALGAAIGLYPGIRVAQGLMDATQTEGFAMKLVVSQQTYLMALAAPVVLVFLAQWPGLRRISRLDLAGAIRLRDE